MRVYDTWIEILERVIVIGLARACMLGVYIAIDSGGMIYAYTLNSFQLKIVLDLTLLL
jgi:hypothetical protein